MYSAPLKAGWRPSQVGGPRHATARRVPIVCPARRRHDQEHDTQKNVDAEQLLSKRSSVAEGTTEGQAQGDSSKPSGKAKRGRRPRNDPNKMLNADGDPLNSDPGSLGKLAPGVLEKYEHLDKLKPQEGEPVKRHRSKVRASSPSRGASSGGGEPAPESDTLKTDSSARETQHPGEAPAAPLVPAQKEFEGTGGVLLDVSHARPNPYHGEGVGRRDAVRDTDQPEPASRHEPAKQAGAGEQLRDEGADFDGFA